MLAAETPFPQQGSWAIYEHDGADVAVRIIKQHRDGTSLIAIEGIPGASGNRIVDLAELRDPTPLSLYEENELHRLERENGRRKRPSHLDIKAETKLRRRLIDAAIFSNLRAVTGARLSA